MSGCNDCDSSTVITIADLALLKANLETVQDVVESPDLFTTTPSGRQIDTLTGALAKLGYEPPIAYAGGISFLVSEGTKTVERDGIVYAPLPSALPFTTSGTWGGDDEEKFFAIQSVMLYSSQITIVKPTVADMQADANLQIGNVIHTSGYLAVGDLGAARYRVVPDGTGTPDGGTFITLTASGFQAQVISDSDRINVAQYGAVGNGSVDDTAAIQAAIDAVSFYGGGELEFPLTGGGTYKCNIVLKPRVSLRGASREVKLVPSTNSPVITLQTDATVSRATIRELTIDGTATQGSFTAQDGIRLAPNVGVTHDNINIEDCLIKNCGASGVAMQGDDTDGTVEHVGLVTLNRVVVENCTGPGVRGVGNVAVITCNQCDFRENGDESNFTLSNVTFQEGAVAPRRIALTGCRLETNSYVSAGYSLAIIGVFDFTLSGCTFSEFQTAVVLRGTDNPNVTIEGNTFTSGSPVTGIVEVLTVNGFIYRGNGGDFPAGGDFGLSLPTDSTLAKRLDIGPTNTYSGLTAGVGDFPITTILDSDTSVNLPSAEGAVPIAVSGTGVATVSNLYDRLGGTNDFVSGRMVTITIGGGVSLTLDHGPGNIRLNGGVDFVLDSISDQITLAWQNATGNWVEVARISVA